MPTLQHGVSQEDFFGRGTVSQSLRDAVFDFASLAHTHLNKVSAHYVLCVGSVDISYFSSTGSFTGETAHFVC